MRKPDTENKDTALYSSSLSGRVALSTATEEGAFIAYLEAYLEKSQQYLLFTPRIDALRACAAQNRAQTLLYLEQAEQALRALDCLEDGAADAVEYAAVLLRNIARTALHMADGRAFKK